LSWGFWVQENILGLVSFLEKLASGERGNISMPPGHPMVTTIVEVNYWGILRYIEKLNIIIISEEKPKLHTNLEDRTKNYLKKLVFSLMHLVCQYILHTMKCSAYRTFKIKELVITDLNSVH
jgi:hypothetical protein